MENQDEAWARVRRVADWLVFGALLTGGLLGVQVVLSSDEPWYWIDFGFALAAMLFMILVLLSLMRRPLRSPIDALRDAVRPRNLLAAGAGGFTVFSLASPAVALAEPVIGVLIAALLAGLAGRWFPLLTERGQ